MITTERDAELVELIQSFGGKSYFYFVNKEFMNNELDELRGLVIKVAETINTRQSETYKD